MDILVLLANKILFLIFILSILNVLREIFLFVRHLNKIEPEKYVIGNTRLLYLALALSYILTTIFKGISL
jgi:hypothetical protein